MWRLWQGWQYISIESLFPKIWSFEDICGSSGMLENRPTHQLLKCYSQPVVSCGICGRDGNTFQLSLSFQICFEDPSGSPGMLENRLAHQILLSVSQYCLTFGFPGGQHFYIASFFQEFSQRFVKISGSPGLLENTPTPNITPMSVSLSGICGRGGNTLQLLLSLKEWLKTLLAALACLKIQPPPDIPQM